MIQKEMDGMLDDKEGIFTADSIKNYIHGRSNRE